MKVYKKVEKKNDRIKIAINKAMINVLRFSNILASINYLYINIITEATAHGSSSERDK